MPLQVAVGFVSQVYSPRYNTSDGMPCINLAKSVQVHAAGPTPAPRGGHAAVSVGTRVLLYGGTDRQATPYTDLWMLETGEPPLLLHLT